MSVTGSEIGERKCNETGLEKKRKREEIDAVVDAVQVRSEEDVHMTYSLTQSQGNWTLPA
jgi:hypothetical protein